MRKLIYILLACSYMLISCNDDIQDQAIPADTYPSILGQWPSGNPGNYSVTLGNTLEIQMQFAPSKLCTGKWYINNIEYTTGTSLSYSPPAVGIYQLRLEVSTDYYTTSRSAVITVE